MRRKRLLFMFAAALLALAASSREARAQFDTTTMTNDYLRMQNQVITHTTTRNAIRSRRAQRAPRVYNPARYNGTRRVMSARAASRAASKRRAKRARKAVRKNRDD